MGWSVNIRRVYRPKIQRLVTPLRLQRRRHLRALKIRRLEHQKEQKAEYECVSTLFLLPLEAHVWHFQCPYRETYRRKEGEGCRNQSITQEVRLYLNISSASKLTLQSQDCVSAGSYPGICIVLYLLRQFRVVWYNVLMACHFYIQYFPESIT